MDEFGGRFAPSAESGVCAIWQARSIQPRGDSEAQHVPVSRVWRAWLCSYCICVAVSAACEVMRRIHPHRSEYPWRLFRKLALSGVDMVLVARRVRILLTEGLLGTQVRWQSMQMCAASHVIESAPAHAGVGPIRSQRRGSTSVGMYCWAQAAFLESRPSSLLLPVDRTAPPLVGYLPLLEKGISSARAARPPLHHSGDMTRKANDCATPVAYSSSVLSWM